MQKTTVLFVCMGNICRSPTAQGVFERLLEQHGLTHAVSVDSAGTHAYHIGHQPDRRSQAAAARRGLDISRQRARRITPEDFHLFDYVLAMDRENLAALQDLAPPQYAHKPRLLLSYAPHLGELDVPDPYYGMQAGFERVLDLIEIAAEALLAEIRKQSRSSVES